MGKIRTTKPHALKETYQLYHSKSLISPRIDRQILGSDLFISTFTFDRPPSDDLHKIPFTLFCKAFSESPCSVRLSGVEFKRFLEAFRSAIRIRGFCYLQVVYPKVGKCGGERRGAFQSGDETLICPFGF